MTEPQELRSIDELFRNTFNNLPDTPSETGWDTPSEKVWQHVRENIQAPRSGWSMQSLMLLTGFAVILAVGLYFVFSAPEKIQEQPAVIPVVTPVEAPVVAPEKAATTVVNHEDVVAIPTPVRQKKAPAVHPAAPLDEPVSTPARVNNDRILPRTSGAVPLPGTSSDVKPNTTEERKAERVRQLEQRWRTPLDLLPLPKLTKAED